MQTFTVWNLHSRGDTSINNSECRLSVYYLPDTLSELVHLDPLQPHEAGTIISPILQMRKLKGHGGWG